MITVRFDELTSNVGLELGPSVWRTIHQGDIDAFAAVTGDDQWIHTDPMRAVADGQAGALAHGLLTLSLIPGLLRSLWAIEGLARTVNYGLDRCRFPAPVLAGGAVRLRATMAEATGQQDGSLHVAFDAVIECQGVERPVCVARTLSRYYPLPGDLELPHDGGSPSLERR
jgi:acyl dehydratase